MQSDKTFQFPQLKVESWDICDIIHMTQSWLTTHDIVMTSGMCHNHDMWHSCDNESDNRQGEVGCSQTLHNSKLCLESWVSRSQSWSQVDFWVLPPSPSLRCTHLKVTTTASTFVVKFQETKLCSLTTWRRPKFFLHRSKNWWTIYSDGNDESLMQLAVGIKFLKVTYP